MSPEMLKLQRHMLTTNRLEAMHNCTLRITPKNLLHRKTYESRCYAGVLHHTLGPHEAAVQTGEEIGYDFSDGAEEQLARLAARKEYHRIRQQSMAYKQARFARLKRKTKIQNLRRLGIIR